jgi:hypothetical protein
MYGNGPIIGTLHRDFTVPEMEGGQSDDPLDLGVLEVTLAKR